MVPIHIKYDLLFYGVSYHDIVFSKGSQDQEFYFWKQNIMFFKEWYLDRWIFVLKIMNQKPGLRKRIDLKSSWVPFDLIPI